MCNGYVIVCVCVFKDLRSHLSTHRSLMCSSFHSLFIRTTTFQCKGTHLWCRWKNPTKSLPSPCRRLSSIQPNHQPLRSVQRQQPPITLPCSPAQGPPSLLQQQHQVRPQDPWCHKVKVKTLTKKNLSIVLNNNRRCMSNTPHHTSPYYHTRTPYTPSHFIAHTLLPHYTPHTELSHSHSHSHTHHTHPTTHTHHTHAHTHHTLSHTYIRTYTQQGR